MKNLFISLMFMLAQYSGILAQSHNGAEGSNVPANMAMLSHWQGQWKGEATMNRNGQQQEFKVEETVTMKLNGTILTAEGIGKETHSEKTVHHAFGVLHHDATTNQYKFQTYLADGKTATAWFIVTDSSHYQWGFDVPSGKIRYTITIDGQAGTWDETGEYSGDGHKWFPFLKMHLKKVE